MTSTTVAPVTPTPPITPRVDAAAVARRRLSRPWASLAALAERLLERTADSDEYYRRRELLVCFAQHSGLETYAKVAGRELARENPAFRIRWLRQPALR